jgi:hypothetical protein
MPKDEWGVKRLCPTCSTRFYDLRHDPMTCPTCGAVFSVESLSAVKPKALRTEKLRPEPVDLEDLPELEHDDAIESDDDLDDEILEDEEDSVDLEDIADVGSDEEDN